MCISTSAIWVLLLAVRVDRTVDQILANSSAEPKFQTAVFGSFGALGLILATATNAIVLRIRIPADFRG